jgi:anti-anti-sigma factor
VTKAKSAKPESTVLRIDGEITIYRATELKELLFEPFRDTGEANSPIEIDLSAVSEIDCAGIQLLMLAKKTAQQRQRELRMTGHSPAVVEAFELLNLGGYFGDPMVIAPDT